MYWVMSKLSAGCCMHFTTNIMSSNSSQYIMGSNLSMVSLSHIPVLTCSIIWWPYAGFFRRVMSCSRFGCHTLENSM